MGVQHLSRELMRRCDELGAISDEPGRLTRTFRSPAMARANALVADWMRQAGLEVREDAASNLLGRWRADAVDARTAGTLLLGSHLDTVRDAGKYDGPLGVLVALAAVAFVRERGHALPFDVEVVGFSDEEGVRHQTTYLGSGAMAGTLSSRDLARIGEPGLARARRRRGELIAYVEAHIEQGPVLEQRGLPVGVVTGIAGQSRICVELRGRAGHAGTTPMDLRQDALCGAAELVLAAERCGAIATVGQVQVEPGASNVIPGRVTLSLDVRHARDAPREAAVRRLHARARAIARRRGLRLAWTPTQTARAVRCDPALTRLLAAAVARNEGGRVPPGAPPRERDRTQASVAARITARITGARNGIAGGEAHAPRWRQGLARERARAAVARLPSGAGHDAAALARLCPVAMLFVRCRGGVSHHPAESVRRADVAVAIAVMADFIVSLTGRRR